MNWKGKVLIKKDIWANISEKGSLKCLQQNRPPTFNSWIQLSPLFPTSAHPEISMLFYNSKQIPFKNNYVINR